MENELISIIVPVYNVEQYLDECVNSIIKQTYTNLEIILIDDGSTDTSGKMCDEYAGKDERIKVVHKENGGLSSARNAGLDICTGEYISFIDSDDYVEIDFIGYMYRSLQSNNVKMLGCKWRFVFLNGKIEEEEKTLIEQNESQKDFFKNLLYGKRAIGQWAYLFKKEIFNNLRFKEGVLFEDSDIMYKIVNKCDKIAISNKQLYFYRFRQGSITNSMFDERKIYLIEASDNMCKFVLDKYPDLYRAVASKMVWACYSTLNQLYKSNAIDINIEKMILDTARPYENTVLCDKDASTRDKLGIIMRKFGRKFYILSWNLYMKIFKS